MTLDNFDMNPFHVSMDSFDQFDPYPVNWEEIASFLNGIIDSRIAEALKSVPEDSWLYSSDIYQTCNDISEKVWDQYCNYEFDSMDDCPGIKTREGEI